MVLEKSKILRFTERCRALCRSGSGTLQADTESPCSNWKSRMFKLPDVQQAAETADYSAYATERAQGQQARRQLLPELWASY